MLSVEFFFDYASPWSYLANELVPRLLPDVPVAYRPVYLRGFPQFRNGVPHDAKRLAYMVADLRRCSEHWGVPVRVNSGFPVNGLYPLRAALWAQEHAPDRFAALHQALFRAAWRDDVDVSRKETVAELARRAGVDVSAAFDDPAVKERLRADTDAVQARGAFGVPAFFLGDELYFGSDRMEYVHRAWLAKTR